MAGLTLKRRVRLVWLAAAALLAAACWSPAAAPGAPGDVYQSDFNFATVWKYPGGAGTDTALEWGQHPQLTNLFSITLGADGQVYAGDDTGKIWRIGTADGAETVAGTIPEATGWALAPAPQGRIAVLDSFGNDVHLFNPADGTAVEVFHGPVLGQDFESIEATRDGAFFITDSFTDSVYVLRGGVLSPLVTGDPSFVNPGHTALSADERYLYVTVSSPSRLVRIDLRSGVRSAFPLDSSARGLALTSDNRVLISFNDGIDAMPAGGGAQVPFASDPDVGGGGDVVIEPFPCAGRTPTVVGTTGNDVLRGSPFADVISTLGGKDKVKALGGRDIICGGPGRDVLIGGAGNDKLLGQGGRDVLRGGKGKDKLKGGAGKDSQRQ